MLPHHLAMLSAAVARLSGPNYRLYVGVYPNDPGTIAAARAVDHKIAQRAGSMFEYGAIGYDAQARFTAHPLGGAVLGKATDNYGRVHGHRGLYVVDGAAMPGSSAASNPSLTISALAERNIEAIVRSGG